MARERIKIGVTDSGFGGLSVLSELSNTIPEADYIYYGDLLNAPYGNKPPEQVYGFLDEISQFFLGRGVSAIVVACNTATSVAINKLRKKYSVPIFGMEPAIKPAALENPDQTIAVLATPLTLKEEKFMSLGKSLEKHATLKPIPCDGLATIIDTGDIEKAREYLQPIFKNLEEEKIDLVVLGCTHYVLVKSLFYDWNKNVKLYDGNKGTANHVRRTIIPLPIEGECKLDLFLNGGREEDFEIAYNYLNNQNTNERNYVK